MEFIWRISFLLLTLVSVLFQTSNQSKYFYADRCPSTEQSWKHQSQRLNCTFGSSFNEYHCLTTSENRLIELCYQNIAFSPKDGCPYFSMNNGFGILQRECIGNRSGCPDTTKNKSILSSEGYKFPNCLIVHRKGYDKDDTTMYMSTSYTTTDIDVTADLKDIRIKGGNIATAEGLFFSIPVLLLGGGIFFLICIFIGCVAFLQYKRITRLLQRVESANYMSSVPYNTSGSHPYHESENEIDSAYDYAYSVDETVRPASESASYLEPTTKSEVNVDQNTKCCNDVEDNRSIAAAMDSKL